MTSDFRPVARATLLAWSDALRQAIANTNKASDKWTARSDELNELHARLHPLSRRDIRSKDPTLADAYAEWAFWKDEVLRWHATIQAEKSLRDMLGVG